MFPLELDKVITLKYTPTLIQMSPQCAHPSQTHLTDSSSSYDSKGVNSLQLGKDMHIIKYSHVAISHSNGWIFHMSWHKMS